MPAIVVEGVLSANGPYVRDLFEHGCHFILTVKEGDRTYLFEEVRCREDMEWVTIWGNNPAVEHAFAIVPKVPLNEAHPDLGVTFVRYLETDETADTCRMFTWITEEKQSVQEQMLNCQTLPRLGWVPAPRPSLWTEGNGWQADKRKAIS